MNCYHHRSSSSSIKHQNEKSSSSDFLNSPNSTTEESNSDNNSTTGSGRNLQDLQNMYESSMEEGKTVVICRFPNCDYKSDKNSNFKRHFETMHQLLNPPITCCDIRFLTKSEFRFHSKSIHREGHRCNICGKVFNRKALLERHMSIHNGRKPFKCSRCSYASANKANVIRHLSIHTPGKSEIISLDIKVCNGSNSPNVISRSPSTSSLSSSQSLCNSTPSIASSSSSSTSPTSEISGILMSPTLHHLTSSGEDIFTIRNTSPKSRKGGISHSIESILSQPYRRRHIEEAEAAFVTASPTIMHEKSSGANICNNITTETNDWIRNVESNWSHTSSLQPNNLSQEEQQEYCPFAFNTPLPPTPTPQQYPYTMGFFQQCGAFPAQPRPQPTPLQYFNASYRNSRSILNHNDNDPYYCNKNVSNSNYNHGRNHRADLNEEGTTILINDFSKNSNFLNLSQEDSRLVPDRRDSVLVSSSSSSSHLANRNKSQNSHKRRRVLVKEKEGSINTSSDRHNRNSSEVVNENLSSGSIAGEGEEQVVLAPVPLKVEQKQEHPSKLKVDLESSFKKEVKKRNGIHLQDDDKSTINGPQPQSMNISTYAYVPKKLRLSKKFGNGI